MITISGYLHRNDLSDIIRCWMYGYVNPSDADRIAQLVHFNNAYVSRYLKLFSEKVFQTLHQCTLKTRPAFLKRDLKDIIVANPPYHNSRIDELIRNYYAEPGRFYRETPFHATLFFRKQDGIGEYMGSHRIKRVHRLAEKSARKIIDMMFDTIRKRADLLADDRARFLNIPRHQLLTSQEEMTEEFLKAENRLLEDLRQKREIRYAESMVINDVAGMKVILDDSEQGRLITVLDRMGDCEIVEQERHSGRYNATNLIVSFRPPREEILVQPLSKTIIEIMQIRGLSPEESNNAFIEFVRSGEECVNLEVIVSNYEEMLESEIGRCMHEDRIIEQRLRQQYRGHLARNIVYLMEYLFTFPVSGKLEIGELPIKLWNRYLPDYFDEVLRNLFQVPQSTALE
jgi:ppGpp synthetase/RelA/SpoT-type nucleotidyltranferase